MRGNGYFMLKALKTDEPIIITLKPNNYDTEIYLESTDNKWEGKKHYATIKGAVISELDFNQVRYWVEETYYEWDYDISEPSIVNKEDFLAENTSVSESLNKEGVNLKADLIEMKKALSKCDVLTSKIANYANSASNSGKFFKELYSVLEYSVGKSKFKTLISALDDLQEQLNTQQDFLAENNSNNTNMTALSILKNSILGNSNINSLNEKFEFLDVMSNEPVCTGKNINVCINQLNKQLNELNLEEIEFIHLDLTKASFSNSKLTEAHFSSCDLTEANFSNTTCDYVVYENCDLTNAKFINSDVQKTQFINCVMTNVNFKNANTHGLFIDKECSDKDTIKY